jgi:hypothetical protein
MPQATIALTPAPTDAPTGLQGTSVVAIATTVPPVETGTVSSSTSGEISTTTLAAAPPNQDRDDTTGGDLSVIGGAAGGAAGLLLVVAAIGGVLACKRRGKQTASRDADNEMQTARYDDIDASQSARSQYAQLSLKPAAEYVTVASTSTETARSGDYASTSGISADPGYSVINTNTSLLSSTAPDNGYAVIGTNIPSTTPYTHMPNPSPSPYNEIELPP